MHFINVLDKSANGMKLVTYFFFEGTGTLNMFVAAFYQLQVILEFQFMGFRMMVEHSLQREPNVTAVERPMMATMAFSVREESRSH